MSFREAGPRMVKRRSLNMYDHASGHHCAKVPDQDLRVQQLFADARRWVEVRKLELGGYVRDLLIAASNH